MTNFLLIVSLLSIIPADFSDFKEYRSSELQGKSIGFKMHVEDRFYRVQM